MIRDEFSRPTRWTGTPRSPINTQTPQPPKHHEIVVCVKQVPEITNVRVNPETGTLIREGVASILNPFCEYALDHAVRLKAGKPGIEITAVSMGPPQAGRRSCAAWSSAPTARSS